MLYSVDPEATPLGLDSLSTINPDVLPEDLRKAVESIQVYGPQVRCSLRCSLVVVKALHAASVMWVLEHVVGWLYLLDQGCKLL